MKKISAVVAVSVALLGLSVSTAVYAAPVAFRVPVHAMFERTGLVKARMVKFSLRNDTGAPLELKVGETAMTLETGKTVPMKLAVGTRICTNAETGRHKSGDVLVEVASQLSDATIGIK